VLLSIIERSINKYGVKNKGKYLVFSLLLLTLFSFSSVQATHYDGHAVLGFDGDSVACVGENLVITLYISDVENAIGGVASMQGNLVFDPEYLEYVSGTGTREPYPFLINPNNNYIIAGLDTTLSNGISRKTTIMTFVFRPLKDGITEISLQNAKITDTKYKMSNTVVPKKLMIVS